MNILISAAATASAYQLERLLQASPAAVFFADSVELPRLMLHNREFIRIPPGTSASFAHELLRLCLDNNIGRVFPLRRAEIKALAEARLLFEEYDIEVMVPPLPVVDAFDMAARPGPILVKERSDQHPTLPPDADRGVFLMQAVDSGTQIAIFAAD